MGGNLMGSEMWKFVSREGVGGGRTVSRRIFSNTVDCYRNSSSRSPS
jgi:hypothetical protein